MFMGTVTALIAVYFGLVFLVYISQRSLMYNPGTTRVAPEAHNLPEMKNLELTTADGLIIQSWYAAPQEGQPILIFFQGNAGAIADRADKVRPYLNAGLGVILAGYRGFGGNPGSPTETGLYEDASTILGYLLDNKIQPEQWVIYGESLGAGVATEMAHRYSLQNTPVGLVILEAPFTSMGDAAAFHYPLLPARYLVRDKYSSISKIGKINAPLLIFHGREDETVPQKLGKELFKEAHEPKLSIWIDDAGHNNLYDFGAAPQILNFINQNKYR